MSAATDKRFAHIRAAIRQERAQIALASPLVQKDGKLT